MEGFMGLHTPSKEFQRLSVRLAENAADLEAVQRLRWQIFRSEPDGMGGGNVLAALDADRYDDLCDHLLVVDEALQMHGGMGYSAESEIETLYRNIRGNRIYEGTNEINRLMACSPLARRMTGPSR